LGARKGLGAPAEAGATVRKIGRSTDLTVGRVTAFEVDELAVAMGRVDNRSLVLRFDGQIEIEGEGGGTFSKGGDSGALIVDEACQAVAVLFAGSDRGGSNGRGLTYANPIGAVLDALAVDLVC